MLYRVHMQGIKLPRLYVAENNEDAKDAMEMGVPFIKWKKGNDELIRLLLRPTLERMFPYVNWNKVLGPREELRSTYVECAASPSIHSEGEGECDRDDAVVDYASGGFRDFDAIGRDGNVTTSLERFMADKTSRVDLDVLQDLNLLPKFMGDIADCIKVNLTAPTKWSEGWNKKKAASLGNFNRSGQLPNLIILDVSGSIPRGISATMIQLIDTLRTQLSADLIITSSISKFYPAGSQLPDPEDIRLKFGFMNESSQFYNILKTEIRGRKFGHVIAFGDSDRPEPRKCPDLLGTEVMNVHNFHTGLGWKRDDEYEVGYAEWTKSLANAPAVEYNTEWCEVIQR